MRFILLLTRRHGSKGKQNWGNTVDKTKQRNIAQRKYAKRLQAAQMQTVASCHADTCQTYQTRLTEAQRVEPSTSLLKGFHIWKDWKSE